MDKTTDQQQERVLKPRDFGALGDGRTLDTAPLQQAVDEAHRLGGGVVLLENGVFLSGTLVLKSDVILRVEPGATLLGSAHREEYRDQKWSALIEARGQERIGIEGEGTIDGQGRQLAADVDRLVREKKIDDPGYHWNNRPSERFRPQLIELIECRGVRIQDVLMRDASCWVQTYDRCEDLVLERVRVRSTAFWNNDGMDIVDCRRVRIVDCDVDSADDGICLKSETPGSCCEDVLIERCRIRSSANAFKLGTASVGGFRRIVVRDLMVHDTYRSAIALESVDGGVLEDVTVSGVRARNTGNAVFIRLGRRNRQGGVGGLRGVVIEDVQVEVPAGKPDQGYEMEGPAVEDPHNPIPSSIVGLPGHPVQNVVLRNVKIEFEGGGDPRVASVRSDALDRVPEHPGHYPEFSMFGELPAWGLYIRHAEDVRLEGVSFVLGQKDYRPALVADDVAGLDDQGTKISGPHAVPAVIRSNASKE